jgi:hypothetical protein
LREWIVFQGEREDAAGVDFEFGNAVPARVNLGGLQDFTPIGVKRKRMPTLPITFAR